jgi:N-acetylneuraminic acid mutarotase
MTFLRTTVLLAFAVVASATSARAHFLWIAPDASPKPDSSKVGRVHVYFSEKPEADDPELLGRLKGLKVQQVSAGQKPQTLELKTGEDSLIATPAGAAAQSYSLDHTYGLLDRNGEVFLLVYHGRMYPANSKNQWTPPTSEERLPLELVPTFADGRLAVRVLWQGQPLAGAEVHAIPAGAEAVDGKSDDSGQFSLSASHPGQYALRAKYVEPRAGERDGKKYATVRHYSTLVVTIAGEAAKAAARTEKRPMRRVTMTKMMNRGMRVAKKAKRSAVASGLPDLPFGITSFGAALLGDNIYVCEGQLGPAHEYSVEGQSDKLLRLDLAAPRKWDVVGKVPHRSGLAMVSYGGKAYRVGGFEARNKKGEPADIHSTREFSRFDPATGQWEELAPLPQPRSSHDAVMVGSRLIVVGGWELRGKEPSIWHDSALEIDLSAAHPEWKELPRPPFHRRALAVGESHGKVYVIGGMDEKGESSTTTYVLDLASGKWSPGPKLPGEGLEGFGGAAVTCAGRLYTTTYSGKLSVLSEDGREWQSAGQLAGPRFFHRMLNRSDASLIVIGGGNMESGKDPSLEIIPVGVARTAGR